MARACPGHPRLLHAEDARGAKRGVPAIKRLRSEGGARFAAPRPQLQNNAPLSVVISRGGPRCVVRPRFGFGVSAARSSS